MFYTGNILSISDGTYTTSYAYDANGTPLTVTWNGAAYYYVTNLQGDVVAILNASGSPVVQYTYDAWGKLISTTGTMATTLGAYNPLRYRGYVYDTETDLYYYRADIMLPLSANLSTPMPLFLPGRGSWATICLLTVETIRLCIQTLQAAPDIIWKIGALERLRLLIRQV